MTAPSEAKETLVFRRAGLRLAAWRAVVLLFWTFAAVFALAFGIALFQPWSFDKIFFLAAVALLVYATARSALGMHSWVRGFRAHYLALGDEGVRFHFSDAGEVRLLWSDIIGVTSEKRWMGAGVFW